MEMTDEERQKLCAALRTQITESWFYLDSEDAYHGIVRPMGEVAADEIERLAKENERLQQALRLGGTGMTDEERQKLITRLRDDAPDWTTSGQRVRMLCDEIEQLAALAQSDPLPREHQDPSKWVSREDMERAQSDAEPQETWNKQPPGPDSILHELGNCPTQSDAEPAQSQTLRDAAENLLIAIGMGWDIEGCVENLRATLAQSDAEPKNVWGMLEKAIIASTLPEHKAADAEFMRASIRLANEFAKDALAALAQSDAEPVAWQTRAKGSKDWCIWQREGAPYDDIDPKFYEARPLYAAPPRPDTSAGMSWSGFNVYGDKKSIDAVRNALHAKDRCEALDKMIGEKQLVRPDTSAGLIEAAELLESIAKIELTISRRAAFNEAAVFLRARAASEPNQARNREGEASARECGQ